MTSLDTSKCNNKQQQICSVTPTTADVLVEEVSEAQLCKPCQQLDVVGLLSGPARDYGTVVGVRHLPDNTAEANCALCRLLYKIRLPCDQLNSGSVYDLCIGPFPSEILFMDREKRRGKCLTVVPAGTTLHEISEIWHGHSPDIKLDPWKFRRVLSCLVLQQNPSIAHAVPRPFQLEHVDWKLVLSWLQQCQTYASPSRHRLWGEKILGSIREQSRELRMQSCFLIDCTTKTMAPWSPECKYLGLSYVWGQVKGFQDPEAKKSSLWRPSLAQALPVNLPQTIVDAVRVTLQLGYQYLWVDKYCIDQCDESCKALQIATMDLIYSGADVTLIAAAGEDDTYGLPGAGSRPRLFRAQYLRYAGQNTTLMTSIQHDRFYTEIANSCWASRGWTYQECELSQRCLVFTQDQVYFECRTCETSHWESAGTTRLDRGYFSTGRFGSSVYKWPDVWDKIGAYNARRLTVEGDRCNAIQGVLNAHGPNFYGLPVRKDGVHGNGDWLSLAWRHSAQESEGKISAKPRRRSQMPSFSWVGWKGGHPLAQNKSSSSIRLYEVRNLVNPDDITINLRLVTDPVFTIDILAPVQFAKHGFEVDCIDSMTMMKSFGQFATRSLLKKCCALDAGVPEDTKVIVHDLEHLPLPLNAAGLACLWIDLGRTIYADVQENKISGIIIYKFGQAWERVGYISSKMRDTKHGPDMTHERSLDRVKRWIESMAKLLREESVELRLQ